MARILVIDDDEQIRNMLHIMLKNEGYDVAEAPEGKVALELFSRAPFDVVITDIVMPEKEGLETIMALKQHYPAVRIIAISGGGRVNPGHYLDGARALGAEFTFTKPVKLDRLLSAVKMLIEHAQ
jgi:DNA-binding NtrC family response regulator